MAVSAKLYGKVFIAMANKEIDWADDNFKVMLCTSSYTPSQAHDYKDDITNEISGTGYTAGGAAIDLTTPTYDTGTGVLSFNGPATTQWTTATFTARYAVIYDDSPATDATKPLIGYVDFGSDQSPSAGTMTITWTNSKVATLTVSV